MKHTPATTLHIPDTFDDRYEVTYDTNTECPLEWSSDHEFYLIGAGYSSTLEDFNSDEPHMVDYAKLREDGHSPEFSARVIKKLHGVDVNETTLRGYSQGDWWDVAYSGDLHIDEIKQWLVGDVYVVTDTLTGDSLGGIFADSMEEAVYVYIDHQDRYPSAFLDSAL